MIFYFQTRGHSKELRIDVKIKNLKSATSVITVLITYCVALYSSEPTPTNPTLRQRFSNSLQWLFGQKQETPRTFNSKRAYKIRQQMINKQNAPQRERELAYKVQEQADQKRIQSIEAHIQQLEQLIQSNRQEYNQARQEGFWEEREARKRLKEPTNQAGEELELMRTRRLPSARADYKYNKKKYELATQEHRKTNPTPQSQRPWYKFW